MSTEAAFGKPVATQDTICSGSNRWGRGEDILGKGRCAECGQLITCNSSGTLFTHRAEIAITEGMTR
jgi:hypothetical protein